MTTHSSGAPNIKPHIYYETYQIFTNLQSKTDLSVESDCRLSESEDHKLVQQLCFGQFDVGSESNAFPSVMIVINILKTM